MLLIVLYGDLGEVLDRITSAPHPLALYVFGGMALADRVVQETTSRSVGINLTVMPFVHGNLPFGEVGISRVGAAHGHTGLAAFSHMRPRAAEPISADAAAVFALYAAGTKATKAGAVLGAIKKAHQFGRPFRIRSGRD